MRCSRSASLACLSFSFARFAAFCFSRICSSLSVWLDGLSFAFEEEDAEELKEAADDDDADDDDFNEALPPARLWKENRPLARLPGFDGTLVGAAEIAESMVVTPALDAGGGGIGGGTLAETAGGGLQGQACAGSTKLVAGVATSCSPDRISAAVMGGAASVGGVSEESIGF